MNKSTTNNKRMIPSPGPRPYGENLSNCFFGRDDEVGKLRNYIQGLRLSVLTAESASGKTSLLQAGLIPKLRRSRIRERKKGKDVNDLTAFPLLLNQWLMRAKGKGRIDFLGIFISEVDRYLGELLMDEENQENDLPQVCLAEQKSLASARKKLRSIICELNLAVINAYTNNLELLPIRSESKKYLLDMRKSFITIIAELYSSLGPILLIFDQFEEILMDPVIGHQAQYIVKSIVKIKKSNVSQLLSLRSDKRHLLSPLERSRLIDGNRIVEIYPLKPDAVFDIVGKMTDLAHLKWEDKKDCQRLIATFTQYPVGGGPAINVNMLGLQIVLFDLLTRLINTAEEIITPHSLCEYCQSLINLENGVEVSEHELYLKWIGDDLSAGSDDATPVKRLVDLAPRSWIEKCLINAANDISDSEEISKKIIPEILKPMVMRMADWLVTPAGFKRPLTLKELQQISYKQDLTRKKQIKAGPAIIGNHKWSNETIENVLENTCNYALERLTRDHILKQRGGAKAQQSGENDKKIATEQKDTVAANEVYFELVHDQFGLPLKSWANKLEKTPVAVLGWPYAITDNEFSWEPSTQLLNFLPGEKLTAIAWIGCSVDDVDFSGLSLEQCDFSRTFFYNCTFSKATFNNCNFEQALLQNCTFEDCTFTECDCNGFAIKDRSSFKRNTFVDSSLNDAIFSKVDLKDCIFQGKNKPQPMNNSQFINSDFSGAATFDNCLLNGAVIGDGSVTGKDETKFINSGDLIFNNNCELNGIEMNSIDFNTGTLTMDTVTARGALFNRLIMYKPQMNETRGLFNETVLTGAVFLGCELRGVDFTGEISEANGVVFRDFDSDDENSKPTIFDDVFFCDVDMDDFNFIDCRIEGSVEFLRCILDGGTIIGSDRNESSTIRGSLRFEQTKLSALEMVSLDFTGQLFEIIDCFAYATYFRDVTFSSNAGKGGACFINTPMASSMFKDCLIHNAEFKGTIDSPLAMESFTIKGTNSENDVITATIGDCSFAYTNMNSFIIEDVEIDGSVKFTNCTLSAARIGNHAYGNATDKEKSHSMQIVADVTFESSCDLRAIHLRNLSIAKDTVFAVNEGNCDGAVFQQLVLNGKIIIQDSSLLRSKFETITSSDDGYIDIRTSDLFYAQIDDALLKDSAKNGSTLLCTAEQLENVERTINNYKKSRKQG